MGKFKDILVEQNIDTLTRTFASKEHLPSKIKEYLIQQGYYLHAEKLVMTEVRGITEHNLHFFGRGNYFSDKLTYTIESLDASKRMIIKTDDKYSFFEMYQNSFIHSEY